MASSVQVLLPSFGYTYTFTGVLSVKHEYSLKLQTDSSSASGEDYINGARNQPDKVILSVMETDIGHQAVPCYYAVCDSLPKAELWTNQPHFRFAAFRMTNSAAVISRYMKIRHHKNNYEL